MYEHGCKKIEREFSNANSKASFRNAIARFDMLVKFVRKCSQLGGMKAHRRNLAPTHVKDQTERFKITAAKLLNRTAPKFGTNMIVMDDETYVCVEV